MNPTHPSKRRRREVSLVPEMLEARELMTGGVGDTFAIIAGSVGKAGQPAAIKFTIDPTHFTIPKGHFLLGIDVASATGGSLKPQIAAVDAPNGAALHVSHGRYAAHLPSGTVAAGSMTNAGIAEVQFNHRNPNAPVTYTVKIRGLKGTTGAFLLGFYLPGNASGSGKVTPADLATVQSELGLTATSSKYTFDADVNRDGRINAYDVSVTKQNMGVSTTINPTVSSTLDPASQTMPGDRVVNTPSAHFTGTATPGATITYQNETVAAAPVSTTADTLGNYNIVVPLAVGSNTFQVTTLDAFGQSIKGTIAAVTYAPNAKKA